MKKFYMEVSDGKRVEVEIEASNTHEALNAALNALSAFACKEFPPPGSASISVTDAERQHLATVRFAFEIEYADDTRKSLS